MKLRILYVSFDEIPAAKGASTHIEAFVGGLGRRYREVLLVTPGVADRPLTPFAAGVEQIVLGCPGENPLARAQIFRQKLVALVRQRGFDVVHFRSIFEGYPLVNGRHGSHPRFVYEVNGLPSIELKYHHRGLLDDPALTAKLAAQEMTCLTAADRVVTVSQVNRQHLIARGVPAEKIVVIPNGVDPAVFTYQPPPLPTSEVFEIAYVGTLTLWQGLDVLVEAIALAARDRAVQLSVIGSGTRRRQHDLLERARRAGAAPHITWCGSRSQSEIAATLHAVQACVVPLTAVDRNLDQGCCPLKLLEAMFAGCPAIASDLPVVRELAEPDRHFLPARPGDAKSLKDAILHLAEQPELGRALAAAAGEHVRTTRTWDRALDALFDVYELLRPAAD